jgi:hypothetical protein
MVTNKSLINTLPNVPIMRSRAMIIVDASYRQISLGIYRGHAARSATGKMIALGD